MFDSKDKTLHYLRSIKTQLGLVKHDEGATLRNEILSDNEDWVDCLIDSIERDTYRIIKVVKA
jgi:hypothetical protein